MHQIWREDGLQRPTHRKSKKARPGDVSLRLQRAEHPAQAWNMDFQFDLRRRPDVDFMDGQSQNSLNIRVGRHCKARDVVAFLTELSNLFPTTTVIRSKNRVELIEHAIRDWCKSSSKTSTAYSEPGYPWVNGLAESFIGGVRDRFLNTELFTTASEVQLLTDRWLWEYNTIRRHLALQGSTSLDASQQGAAA
jgi:putative transposase